MKLGVAIPLIAAICLGSPAMASSNPEEQMVKGKGARDRSGGSSSGATSSGGGERSGGSSSAPRSGGERTSSERRGNDRETSRAPEPAAVTRTEVARSEPDDNNNTSNQRVAVPRRTYQTGGNTYYPSVVTRPSRVVNTGRYYPYYPTRYYTPSYYHRWAHSYYGWSPIHYAPWPLIYGTVGFSNFGFYAGFAPSTYYFGYNGYYGPGVYTPWQVTSSDVGGVRLKMHPRDAQVFVDGNYAGLVDDFDGSFQSLRLQQGGHKIEVHMPGYEDLEIDVHVQPGKTITLKQDLRPRP